ncbi:hypothetical protein GMI70_00315 [Eggerthellaceae bacterium zg-893]|nr:hypothetical protein [Eggerthellaceae bacterium zg-893]
MDMQAFYQSVQADLNDVLALYKTPERVHKYVRSALHDKAFRLLDDAMARKDWVAGFKQAHTVKGMCQNLCLGIFTEKVIDLVECLRGGNPDEEEALRAYDRVRQEHLRLLDLEEALS